MSAGGPPTPVDAARSLRVAEAAASPVVSLFGDALIWCLSSNSDFHQLQRAGVGALTSLSFPQTQLEEGRNSHGGPSSTGVLPLDNRSREVPVIIGNNQ